VREHGWTRRLFRRAAPQVELLVDVADVALRPPIGGDILTAGRFSPLEKTSRSAIVGGPGVYAERG
jgi:hypothetical protein